MTAKPDGSVGTAPADRLTRREVWKRIGPPTDQIGSVNDPRTRDEYGVRWNEKWIYRNGREVERVVLWHRYDLVGVFRVRPDGSAEAESVTGA
jgi:hypothetical protein